MSLMDFLQELRRARITLVRDGESLKVQGPKGALTAELRQSLVVHKAAILDWLRESDSGEHAALPQCEPDPAALFEPFPLADLQLGFYMADDPYMEFHVRPHYFLEKDLLDLDVRRYEAAWNQALQRHHREIVTVRPLGDLVTVRDLEPLRVQVYDLCDRSSADVARSLSEVQKSMMRSELPLDRWPWVDLRVSLWREDGASRARVHYNHNNFFSDGYGTMRLLQEVDRYYREPTLKLPPLSLSFRDATMALEQLARSDLGAADRCYWEARLPGLPGPPDLPMRQGMERRCRSRLNRRERFFSAAVWRSFKENARHFGLTPSNAVFAAYAEILAAWGNSRHFVISNMMTRRLNVHPEINEIIGNFASLYPLEIDLRGSGPFVDRARRIQEQVIRDSQHRCWGGMQVMQAFNRQLGGFGRAPIPFVIGSGLFMEGFERSDFSCLETSQVMLDHQFWELADGRGYYVWDLLEEFFPDGMIDDMGEAYAALVGRLASDAGCWREERLTLIPVRQIEARRATCPPGCPVAKLRLDDLLGAAAAAHPNDLALITSGQTLSYRELATGSDRIAAALQLAGVGRGQTVAVVADRGVALLQGVYGILKAGAAYVPIDPSLPDERRFYLLENSGARHVIVEEAYAETRAWPVGVALLTPERFEVSAIPPRAEQGTIADLAYVIYTSGSTGRPKGVMIDHQGVINTIFDVNERFRIGRSDRVFGVSSFGFDLSVYDIFGTIAAGATLVYPDPAHALNPARWLDLLIERRVSVWNSAPPLGTLLIEAAEFRGARLPDLRLVLLSGDWIPVDLPDRIRQVAPNSQVVSMGGATEASIWSIVYEIGRVDPSWPSIPYGYPMRNQPWFVLDEWGRPAPEWTPGELYIGGIGLAIGYLKDAERTAAAFSAHPDTGERIYRTGDIGRYLPGGVIEFLGRRDSQVKLQGHRIELGEIEAVLLDCPGVSSAVVVVQSAGNGPQLAAYIVLAAGADLRVEEVREQLGRKLPDYMVPRLFKVLDRLPLSSNGKVDRKALPPLEERPVRATAAVSREPLDDIEAGLLKIWCAVLKHEGITVNDDFFELGGQSIEAVRIVGRIREVFGASLSIGDIWQCRTVAGLAQRVRAGDDARPSRCLVEMGRTGVSKPLFLVHPAGGHVLCYREFAARLARPVFAFQAPGVDGRSVPLDSIAGFARTYIKHLAEVQPDGPVLLGGWSSGGLIAYEMAAQLGAQGRPVQGVVILDSPAPLVHQPVTEQVLYDWFLSDLNLAPAVQSALKRMDREGLSEQQQLEQAAAMMLQCGVDLGADVEQLAAIYRVFKGIVHGSRRYVAGTIDAELLVVRAREGVVSEFAQHPFSDRVDWGWREFTARKVDGEAVDGTHYTLLSLPVVQGVAALVERWLSDRSC